MMRASRFSVTSIALTPRLLSMSSILASMFSASCVPRALMTSVRSPMRLSSVPVTSATRLSSASMASLLPSVIRSATSATRAESTSPSAWVRLSRRSRKRMNCWSMLAVISADFTVIASPAFPSACVICSALSDSVWVMRREASLTCSATCSLICEMSWLRPRWTLLTASRIVREHIQEDNRHEENDGEQRRGDASWAKRGPHRGQIDPSEDQACEQPQARKEHRGHVGRACQTALQRLQEVANRLTVIIGGTARGNFLCTLAHVRVGRGGDAEPLQLLGCAHLWGG